MDDFSSADAVSDDTWDRVLAVNLTVPVKMMRAVLPLMVDRHEGSIINVASTAASSGAVAGVPYTSSKHGLVSESFYLISPYVPLSTLLLLFLVVTFFQYMHATYPERRGWPG
jgi:hypothetical protein